MDQLKKISQAVEEKLEVLAGPLKPHVPLIARFLLVVTFLEDSLRIVTQWEDQLYYLQNFQHMHWFVAYVFLIFNVLAMSAGSVMAIAKKWTTMAVGLLTGVVVLQSIGYGLVFDFNFFFRNLSLIGGLLMLLSEVRRVVLVVCAIAAQLTLPGIFRHCPRRRTCSPACRPCRR